MTQRRGRTMARVSFQTLSRFTFLSDTFFRAVRIVFRAVAFNDAGKKGASKPKQRLYGSHHAGGSITRHRRVLFPGRPGRSPQRQRGGTSDGRTNRNGALAAEGARSWRPEFDLGWACPGLPLNAGRDTHRAARQTWSRLMRKRKHSSWQKRHGSVLPPHSIYLWIPLFVSFPTANRFRHLARCGSIHHRGYFLSLLPSKTLI